MKWSCWVQLAATAFSRKQMVTHARGLRCETMMHTVTEVGSGDIRQLVVFSNTSRDSLLGKMNTACARRDASKLGSIMLPQIWKPWAWGPEPALWEDRKDSQKNPYKNWQKLAKNICHEKFWEEKFSNIDFGVYLDLCTFIPLSLSKRNGGHLQRPLPSTQVGMGKEGLNGNRYGHG